MHVYDKNIDGGSLKMSAFVPAVIGRLVGWKVVRRGTQILSRKERCSISAEEILEFVTNIRGQIDHFSIIEFPDGTQEESCGWNSDDIIGSPAYKNQKGQWIVHNTNESAKTAHGAGMTM